MPSYYFVEATVFLVLCWIAFRFGSREEKLSSSLLLTQFGSVALARYAFNLAEILAQRLSTASDAILVLAFLGIVLKSRKKWPVFALGFQAAEFLLNLKVALRISPYDYQHLTYTVVWGWLVLLAVLAGVVEITVARSTTKPPAEPIYKRDRSE